MHEGRDDHTADNVSYTGVDRLEKRPQLVTLLESRHPSADIQDFAANLDRQGTDVDAEMTTGCDKSLTDQVVGRVRERSPRT